MKFEDDKEFEKAFAAMDDNARGELFMKLLTRAMSVWGWAMAVPKLNDDDPVPYLIIGDQQLLDEVEFAPVDPAKFEESFKALCERTKAKA